MGGFSSITGDETIMNADNASFDGTERGGKMTTDGQLWIGSTASPHVKLGNLTSTGGSITITNGSGTINLESSSSIATSYTTDSGTATPAANILQIRGGPGVTTSGASNVVTINSVVFTDQGGSLTVNSDTGNFATAAITLTTPNTPVQGEQLIFACTSASALVVKAAGGHKIRIGSAISSATGTATSNAIGDSLTLRWRASDVTWYAVSVIGTWTLA